MDVRVAMYRLGGVADRRTLLAQVSRGELRGALADGRLLRLAKGRYALPVVDEATRAAHEMSGVVSHLSAALQHGWEVKRPPERPSLTVPRTRKVAPERRAGYDLHWADLADADVFDGCTSRERTFVDCARTLPFDEALAVADSALRYGLPRERLTAAADALGGAGRRTVARVAAAADGRAANPFESVLRAEALDVPGLHVLPQYEIRIAGQLLARVDLADPARRLVLEADSFEWHGDRKALVRDCRRYTALAVLGWTVLRFSWEDVMLDPAYVRRVLLDAVGVGRTCRSADSAS